MVPNTKTKGCKFGETYTLTHDKDKNLQGKKHKKDTTPDKATTALVKDTEKMGCIFSKMNFHVNERMDLRT